MIRLLALSTALALTGCASMGNAKCFTHKSLVPPNRELVLNNVTNGQAGRDVATAVLDQRGDDVSAMIKRDPRLLTTVTEWDRKLSSERPVGQYGDLLTLAVSRCDQSMMERLLALGMPINGAPRQIGEALTLALLADTPEMAELLLSRGASPDPQKLGGVEAMTHAILYTKLGGIMMLLRHGADVHWQDQFGRGYLQDAVDGESYRAAEALVAGGASFWRIGGDGSMPIQNIQRLLIVDNSKENEARLRLLAKAEADANAKGLPWPPPDFKTVRRLVLSGAWPTPAMIKAGFPPVSEIALKDMRTRFAAETPH